MHAAHAAAFNEQLTDLIACCGACSLACMRCAEALRASGLTDTYRDCAQACSDCADICTATLGVASRYDGGDARAFTVLLRACAKACAACAALRDEHPDSALEDCARAALACRHACERLAGALRWR